MGLEYDGGPDQFGVSSRARESLSYFKLYEHFEQTSRALRATFR